MKLLQRVLRYRDLFLVFVLREFTLRYRYSVVGVAWALLQPLSMMALFTFIFTYIVHYDIARGYPKVLFFYSALLPWTFFASSLNYAVPSLRNHYELITKIYFPREIIPLSGITTAFIDLLIAGAAFLVMMLLYGVGFTAHLIWLPPLLVLLVVFTVAVALLLASLNVYYTDVQLAIRFLVQLWFFASPVLYSIDNVPLKLKLLLFLNPLTFIIENIRRCTIEGRGVVLWQFAVVAALIAVFYVLSYRFFIKTERAFADVI